MVSDDFASGLMRMVVSSLTARASSWAPRLSVAESEERPSDPGVNGAPARRPAGARAASAQFRDVAGASSVEDSAVRAGSSAFCSPCVYTPGPL